MPNDFLLNKYNKSLQGFHFQLFGDTKVSAKYWTASSEPWQKPLSMCFSYSMCSYKTVKVHRLHWSGASGKGKKKKESSWMPVSTLLKLVWHLLNKCSISQSFWESFSVRNKASRQMHHIQNQHLFPRPAIHIHPMSIHNVAGEGKWILL